MNPFENDNNKIYTMTIQALPLCFWDTAFNYRERICDTTPKAFGMSNKCQKMRRSKSNKPNKKGDCHG